MQREEKQLESALEAIIMRVNDLKTAIASMIIKLECEYETLNWPNFLDNFAIISGHLTSLSKILSHDKALNLKHYTVLPLHLSPEKDEELMRLTENRISTFAHDLVPDYLRTKPDPQVEQKLLTYEAKVNTLNFDQANEFNKQVQQYNKVLGMVIDAINKNREEMENETKSRTTQMQTSSSADTHALINAVCNGKGLKSDVQMVQSGVNPVANNMLVGRLAGQSQTPGQGPMGQMSKAPSAIKTNIKAASQIHPYGR
ncbi:mediator of RNA polymerase II transcription subunit 8 isoform X2 [Copidosoma floridanum]|uniref:mediator of RNA polymerase II transcription subunit 8 isoform X2 n=1 Tax=Copidosoma floridanum TaxID=29053 RepID=UPI0006C96EAA|nr:mediator of RNA polymerase II transcription subunit 8 isoform X2 [Copidosoma floridanum]